MITYECSLCGTRFERGVADDDQGQPRCPQCFMTWVRPIDEKADITCNTQFG